MTTFKLPDLGEGLPDAEIVKWMVKEGDTITEGDTMVEMSTAKAVVEVPAPHTGKIIKLHGGPGDVIDTGNALVTFQLEGEEAPIEEPAPEPKKEAPKEEVKTEEKSAASSGGGGEVFKLPDLGEGLPDAEVVKWSVKEGDELVEGETMVEMSTAKAVVEVPAPFSGKVVKLYGGPGDVILTGAPLIEVATGKAPAKAPEAKSEPKEMPIEEAQGDSGTVVGAVVVGDEVTSDAREGASVAVRAKARKLKVDISAVAGTGAGGAITMEDVERAAKGGTPAPAKAAASVETPTDFSVSPSAKATARALNIDVGALTPREGRKMLTKGDVLAAARNHIGGAPQAATAAPVATAKDVKAAPKVRALASERGVDLRTVSPTGHVGNVTIDDVLKAGSGTAPVAPPGAYVKPERAYEVTGQPEKLVGPRRIMAQAMAEANAEVCNTSIFDEVSIARWGDGQDITVRLMRSVIAACFAEPAINAWFDGEAGEKTTHKNVNLGVAVDSPKGLFVPVVKGADAMDGPGLRAELNRLRDGIKAGTIKMEEMSGGTITLSNFGMIAGRFATPIVVPPEVSIVGIGGLYEKLAMTEKGIENQRFIPVSLTFDHRACTGGEAARFLAAILNDLALAF